MKIQYLLLLAVSLAAGAVGCGGDDDDAAPTCASFASSYCGKLSECNGYELRTSYGTKTRCEAQQTGFCDTSGKIMGSNYNAGFLGGCASSLEALSCDEFVLWELGAKAPKACELPKGDYQAGEICFEDEQCAGSHCKLTTQQAGDSCGVCTALPGAGEPCPDYVCAKGYVCSTNPEAPVGVCAQQAAMGGTCLLSSECEDGLSCTNSVCAVPTRGASKGAACSATVPCDFATGLYCDTMSSTCVEEPIASAGQACNLVNSGATVRCDGTSYCNASSICATYLKKGAACDDQAELYCDEGISCEEGICRTPSIPVCK